MAPERAARRNPFRLWLADEQVSKVGPLLPADTRGGAWGRRSHHHQRHRPDLVRPLRTPRASYPAARSKIQPSGVQLYCNSRSLKAKTSKFSAFI